MVKDLAWVFQKFSACGRVSVSGAYLAFLFYPLPPAVAQNIVSKNCFLGKTFWQHRVGGILGCSRNWGKAKKLPLFDGKQRCCMRSKPPFPCPNANYEYSLILFFRREACNEGEGDPPLYVNVNMFSGQLMNTWIDSLQAFFPGLQVSSMW